MIKEDHYLAFAHEDVESLAATNPKVCCHFGSRVVHLRVLYLRPLHTHPRGTSDYSLVKEQFLKRREQLSSPASFTASRSGRGDVTGFLFPVNRSLANFLFFLKSPVGHSPNPAQPSLQPRYGLIATSYRPQLSLRPNGLQIIKISRRKFVEQRPIAMLPRFKHRDTIVVAVCEPTGDIMPTS